MAVRRWRRPTRRSGGAGAFTAASAFISGELTLLASLRCLLRSALSLSASICGSQVFRRHLTYEADWHLPDGSPRLGRLLHLLHVACWLL